MVNPDPCEGLLVGDAVAVVLDVFADVVVELLATTRGGGTIVGGIAVCMLYGCWEKTVAAAAAVDKSVLLLFETFGGGMASIGGGTDM